MANYPASVKTFTTKNATETIQPEHVNSLQDEVTAIEDGLLNGSAPVNSSRITAPASQITNSTVTNLSVTGTSTMADLLVTALPPSVRVTNSAALNTGNQSTTRLTFDTQVFASTTGMHSTGTNPGRLIAVSSGVYVISGSITWVPSTVGLRQLRILIDGSSVAAIQTQRAVDGAFNTDMSIAAVYRFESSGGYAELEAYQNSGSTLSIAASNVPAYFAMTKIR
jgi:hypothetical protein